MNVLIIGLGYAGTRFSQAFSNLDPAVTGNEPVEIAYVNRSPKSNGYRYFSDIETAVKEFEPAVVVVSVNDEYHIDVIKQLRGYRGFVICEKPLVHPQDDLDEVEASLKHTSGFALDLVERYSDASITLKQYVKDHNLRLVRANFYWGKDRINDHRPTSGVISEIIHPLDLVQWVSGGDAELELKDLQGIRSDFSISGTAVLDSAAITANLAGAVVTGYSSFVNILRKREVDLVFASPANKLIFATMIFDTPVWDIDYLRIWEKTNIGERVIVDLKTEIDESRPELNTIRKLIRLVGDAAGFAASGAEPSQPFADLPSSLKLQKLLNTIDADARTIGPVQYVVGSEREFFNDETNWERLG
ncbi:oxidoreductase [Paenibacillus chitinolyticus]|uniref:Oxidoreductase n=1 Tax=Paenibacillus chitinolyticus TaxID=79263 RepID=A0A410WX58_9BACL|nr:Gfo/Idh/MocA family oxidoreductase [Paenibacillus chitinolyticus]MCY9589613.1 Gfo/Idh/MocA family oxidoreductase [Paenibacillus chitinolyticus]MCY9598386.1 Gfo/Idh/MocA family oxidoreductase [Paenibacillus chitinolyticus]QAV18998.1 oxidoreductase [Paenibacillus chitinolyticus]